MQIHDKRFLKRLAAVSASIAEVTPNKQWKKAYMDLHSGASLLWRLCEQSQIDGIKKYRDDESA